MDLPQILHEPWLDRLISESDPDKVHRLVLEAARAMCGGRGVAQWAEVEPGEFRIQRALDDSHEDLDPQVVLEVANGNWDHRQARHFITSIGEAPKRLAWSVGLPVEREEQLDQLDVFLFLANTLHPDLVDGEGPSLLPGDAA